MIKRFLDELRRRRVPQVAGFYLAAGWVVFEVAEGTFPRLGLPDWTVTFVLVLLLLAFPLVIGLAWVYDITPDGVRRTSTADSADAAPAAPSRGSPPEPEPAESLRSDRFARIAVIGAVLVLALAGAGFLLWGGSGPDVELAPDAMVVLPFTVRGGEDVDVLAEGMVELLSTKLDGAGQLRSVDPHTVLSHTGGGVDPSGARPLARRLGAGYYVLGSVLEFGGDLRLQASIYNTTGPRESVAEASVEGPATSFLALVDDLASELLVAGELAPPGRIPRLAAMTTEKLPALKLFLEGERALRETRYDHAIERFQRAVEVDSAFALAYYRMAVAASWVERRPLLHRAMENALHHQERLSERDRALLTAFAARQEGRHAEAARRYRAIVASHPSDVEAWYELGEVLLHSGAFLGIPRSEMAEPFERAVALDSGNAAALYHLSNLASVARDTALLDSWTKVLRDQLGDEMPLTIEAQWAFAAGDPAVRARKLEEVVSAEPLEAQLALVFSAMATDHVEDLRRMAAVAEEIDAEEFVVFGLGNMMATFGLRDEALDWMEEQESTHPGPPVRTALLASQPFLRTPPERLRGLRTRLLEWNPGPVRTEPLGPDEWGKLEPIQPQLRVYLIALLEARLGRLDEAVRRAEELEELGGVPEVRTLADDLARHVRAQVALDEGRTAEALRVIEGATVWEASPWDERTSAVYAFAGPILLRAEALHALGRYREALPWYSTFLIGPQFFGYSDYRRAQANEALGETERAAEQYARFVRRWAHADPELQDLVRDARRRLEALTAEG